MYLRGAETSTVASPLAVRGTTDEHEDADNDRPANFLRTKPPAEYEAAKCWTQGDDAQTGWPTMLRPMNCWHDPTHSPTMGCMESVHEETDELDSTGDKGLKSRQSRRGGGAVETSPLPGSAYDSCQMKRKKTTQTDRTIKMKKSSRRRRRRRWLTRTASVLDWAMIERKRLRMGSQESDGYLDCSVG